MQWRPQIAGLRDGGAFGLILSLNCSQSSFRMNQSSQDTIYIYKHISLSHTHMRVHTYTHRHTFFISSFVFNDPSEKADSSEIGKT